MLIVALMSICKGIFVTVDPSAGTGRRCFSENLPPQSPLKISFGSTPTEISCKVNAVGPDRSVVVHDHILESSGGSVSFESKVDGDHEVCFSCAKPVNVTFAFEHDYTNTGSSTDSSEKRLKTSISLVKTIKITTDYQAKESAKYSDAAVEAQNSVAIMSIISIVMIIVVAFVASRSLGKWVRYSRIV
jgi:emp24/gp25L/p24 family/GOLD